jgi:protein-export membrane protein SecD
MKFSKQSIIAALFIVSLVLVFFVGRKFDAETGTRSLILTTDGVSHFRKGLDVSGGTRLVYKVSYDKYEWLYTDVAEFNALKSMIETIIMKNIDSRISKLGVSDYKAYIQNLDNEHYIVVEIGGIADLDQAKELIGKTLELEFRLENPLAPSKASIAARKNLANQILTQIKNNPDTIQQLLEGRSSENIYYSMYPGATMEQLPEIYKNTPSRIVDAEIGKIYGLIEGTYTTVQNQSEDGLTQGEETAIDGFTMFRVLDKREIEDEEGNIEMAYVIEDVFVQDREVWIPATQGDLILNGAYFKYANTSTNEIGEAVVVINLDEKGKELFCAISERNIRKPMAIFVGGNLLTAPVIQSKICGGTAEINGGFTMESARELSNALNEGTLPAPLILMQEEKISPTLGDNALEWSLRAGLIGFVLILVSMYFVYGYRKALVTGMVLITFLTVLAWFMKLTDYALSLSGIAVVVLAIGMAVDANILIYERMLEELKEGKSIWWAINNAKDKSRSAIRDGQISTGIIAFVLFSMGTNMFKGFWSMLIVTMFLTLLLNVPLTKILLHAVYTKPQK